MSGIMTAPRKRRKKTPKPAADKPKPNRTDNIGVQFYVDKELAAAVDSYLDSLPEDQKPKKRGIWSAAIRKYLESKGYWPPPSSPPE